MRPGSGSRAAARQPRTVWGDGAIVRDYVHVEDVAAALAALAAASFAGTAPLPLFNIGTGRGTSLDQLLAIVAAEVGHPLDIAREPGRPVDVPANVLESGLARRSLGWAPRITLEEGVRRLLAEATA